MKIILLLLLLTSCGQHSSSDEPVTSPAVLANGTLSEPQGQVGPAGKDGANGKDGKDGKDGKTVTSNMWFDPVTSQYWLIGGKGSYTDGQKACSGAWRLATYPELYLATTRGLADLFPAPTGGLVTYFWTSTPHADVSASPAMTIMSYDTATHVGVAEGSNLPNNWVILCIAAN